MGPINPGAAFQGIGDAVLRGQQIKLDRDAALAQQTQRREEAAQRKQEGEYRLAELGRADVIAHNTAGDREALVFQQLQTQGDVLKQQSSRIFQQESFQALDHYFDGVFGADRKGVASNITEASNSINQFLQKNSDRPAGLFQIPGKGKAIRVDPLNEMGEREAVTYLEAVMEEVEPGKRKEMLEKMDLADGSLDGKYDMKLIRSRFLNVTYENGDVVVSDMVTLADTSGYTRWASARTNEEMNKTRKLTAASSGPAPTALTRNAKSYAKARRADGVDITDEEAIIQFSEAHMGGTSSGKNTIADKAFDDWNVAGYQDMTMQELQSDPNARKLVKKIELASELSTAEKKALGDINSVIKLAGSAVNMTPNQTGLWDSMTEKAGTYVSDTIENPGAKSSYAALMNQVRHNLFGATLTEGEIAAFNKAYGSDSQKHGKVLDGLATALNQTQAQLETIVSMNNPAVIKFRTGKSIDELYQIIDTLGQKIAMYADGVPPQQQQSRKPLSEIFRD